LPGIDVGSDGRLIITRQPADPRFEEPLSDLYWQVTDDRDQLLRSRSLWDTTLRLPPDEPGPSEVHQHEPERVLANSGLVAVAVCSPLRPLREQGLADRKLNLSLAV
jgi:hypothetical protein